MSQISMQKYKFCIFYLASNNCDDRLSIHLNKLLNLINRFNDFDHG